MRAVSVVVPTRDRPGALARCLRALRPGGDLFEIVVVDDAIDPGPETAALVEAHPGARLVRTGGRGAAAARNAGVRAAAGSVVLFLDDDCMPGAGWVAALAAAVEGGADVAGGRTEIGRPHDPYVVASESIRRHLEEWTRSREAAPFLASNNVACRRLLALEVPFDESYRGAGGEDRDWCARLAARGARFAYVEEAVLSHVPALGLRGFWQQHVRYGRGAFRFGGSPASARRCHPPGFYACLLRRGFSEGALAGMLVVLAQMATASGYVREAASSLATSSEWQGLRGRLRLSERELSSQLERELEGDVLVDHAEGLDPLDPSGPEPVAQPADEALGRGRP